MDSLAVIMSAVVLVYASVEVANWVRETFRTKRKRT